MDRSTKDATPRDDAEHAAGEPREIELKLFVPPSSASRVWRHPLLLDHAGPAARVVESRYFDTPDGALAGRRMALRMRRDGGRWVQTLKVASPDERALSARGEWETVVDGPALDLAALAGTPFATLDADVVSRLQPVFTTTFRRETKGIRIGGATVEVAFDVGDVKAGGRSGRSLPIHELEIEVKRGAAPDLLRFAARLAKDLPLIPLADSKAARGHRLATGAQLVESRVALPEARPDVSVRAHLAGVLSAGNRALLANAHALFEIGTDDPDAAIEFVHQARIAVRRLRSALQLFAPAVGERRCRPLAKRLQTLGRVFGEARDQDVLATTTLARIERHAVNDDDSRRAFEDLRTLAATKRADAHRALMRFLDAGRFGATTIAVERMADRLAAPSKRDEPLAPRAEAWLAKRLQRIVPGARRIAVLDERRRHRLRIEVKRLRYALDLFEGFYEADAVAAYRDALAELQEKLGSMTDSAVAASLLRAWSDEAPLAVLATRFDGWRTAKLGNQLPRVAALAVALELAPVPWRVPDREAAG